MGYKTEQGLQLILQDVHLEILQGEVVGLVGASGEGKTTLALALLGLLPSNASVTLKRAQFFGRTITSFSESDYHSLRGKEIGLVLQDPLAALNPVLTIGYQIFEVLRMDGNASKDSLRSRAVKLLRDVGVEDAEEVLGLYPHELSGGMRQRVLLVMSLAREPKLLILDEPTAALDAITRKAIIDLILKCKKKFGLSVLLISHDEILVESLCRRVWAIEDGRSRQVK